MDNLPFFVYGTLLPNQPNYYLWKDSIVDTKNGMIRNYELFDMGHYPMIVESEGNNVVGMLVYIKTDDYEEITSVIDNLEGYSPEKHGESAYNRETKNIELENGKMEKALIYIGTKEYIRKENAVEGGNWIAHVSNKSKNQDWWKDTDTVAGLDTKKN